MTVGATWKELHAAALRRGTLPVKPRGTPV